MGNSEVGHLNIGSGRVIRMDISLVDHEIETGAFFRNEVVTHTMDRARDNGKSLHLMGLISDGQVHSSITHLYALLKMAKDKGVERVFVHAFLDGRDTPPASGAQYVATVQRKMEAIGVGEIATVIGRYYAMDRDKRWERTQRAYDLLTKQSACVRQFLYKQSTNRTNAASPTNLLSLSPSFARTARRWQRSRMGTR